MTRVWYLVRDFDRARDFYKRVLGFTETSVDWDERWARLEHGSMQIAIAEGEPVPDGGVATIDVEDVKAEAERLRAAGVDVGVVLERRLGPGRSKQAGDEEPLRADPEIVARRDRLLLFEIAMFDHAGELDDAAQLYLAPATVNMRHAQGFNEVSCFRLELQVRLGECLHLLAQL